MGAMNNDYFVSEKPTIVVLFGNGELEAARLGEGGVGVAVRSYATWSGVNT
jgi:hypothetical protein